MTSAIERAREWLREHGLLNCLFDHETKCLCGECKQHIESLAALLTDIRLEGANELSDKIAVVFLAMEVTKLESTQALKEIQKLCREVTMAYMKREAERRKEVPL